MEKIELNGKQYELPKVTFYTMIELGKLGFKMSESTKEDNFFDTIAILTAYVTRTDVKKACEILDASITDADTFSEISETLSKWFFTSDFFQKMQAKSAKAKK